MIKIFINDANNYNFSYTQLQAAQSSATAVGGGFQGQSSNSAGSVIGGAAQSQQGLPANTVAATQTPGRPPAQIAGAAAAGPGGPTAAGSGDFVKEEIIELQEMRLSPIPSIRNRFTGSGSKVTICISLDTHRL